MRETALYGAKCLPLPHTQCSQRNGSTLVKYESMNHISNLLGRLIKRKEIRELTPPKLHGMSFLKKKGLSSQRKEKKYWAGKSRCPLNH